MNHMQIEPMREFTWEKTQNIGENWFFLAKFSKSGSRDEFKRIIFLQRRI